MFKLQTLDGITFLSWGRLRLAFQIAPKPLPVWHLKPFYLDPARHY